MLLPSLASEIIDYIYYIDMIDTSNYSNSFDDDFSLYCLDLLKESGIEDNARAEEIDIETYIEISDKISRIISDAFSAFIYPTPSHFPLLRSEQPKNPP